EVHVHLEARTSCRSSSFRVSPIRPVGQVVGDLLEVVGHAFTPRFALKQATDAFRWPILEVALDLAPGAGVAGAAVQMDHAAQVPRGTDRTARAGFGHRAGWRRARKLSVAAWNACDARSQFAASHPMHGQGALDQFVRASVPTTSARTA